MKSKNITLRLKMDDFDYFNELAAKKGMTRTEMIRSAVKKFGSPPDIAPAPPTSIGIASRKLEKVVRKGVSIADFEHPLLDKIEKDGLSIILEDETRFKIYNLKDLLNFVQNKVLG